MAPKTKQNKEHTRLEPLSNLGGQGRPCQWYSTHFLTRCSRGRAKITVMSDDLPLEQHIFHLRPLSNVVHNQVAATLRRFLSHHDPDVQHSASQIPRNN